MKHTKRRCQFCKNHTTPDYKDSAKLLTFMSRYAKIEARSETGLCAKHQRRLTESVKRARFLALLPYTVR